MFEFTYSQNLLKKCVFNRKLSKNHLLNKYVSIRDPIYQLPFFFRDLITAFKMYPNYRGPNLPGTSYLVEARHSITLKPHIKLRLGRVNRVAFRTRTRRGPSVTTQ